MAKAFSGHNKFKEFEVMLTRRKLFRTAAMTLGAAPLAATAASKKNRPERMPVQVGDVLAFPSWEQEGRLVKASEVQTGAKPLTVFPHDKALEVTRERYRLNQLLLVRLEASDLDEDTLARSADGLLVYSGTCTHTACAVTEWDAAKQHFICPCHSSEFDPKNRAKVINGPATRSLPSLEVKLVDDLIVVAGGFSGKVGAKKKPGF